MFFFHDYCLSEWKNKTSILNSQTKLFFVLTESNRTHITIYSLNQSGNCTDQQEMVVTLI